MIEKSRNIVYNLIMGNIDYLIKVRRDLHIIPEISEHERATGDYIAARLAECGLKFRRMGTGIICDVKGENTNYTTALRADIDALPIVEKADCSFPSTNGNMHACGHDGHMAMLLCIATKLSERKPKNNIRLIFQYGEEGNGGADKMISGGVIEGVDEIFAFHMCPELDKGKVSSIDGAMFAGTAEFDVTFTGKGKHCAVADGKADALMAAIGFYTRAQDCNADKRRNTKFHIGKLTGGTARNVVASDAKAYCTLRYFDSSDLDLLMMRLESYLVECDNKYETDHRVIVNAVYPPLVNNPSSLAKVRQKVNVLQCEPRFTAEDFAFYLTKIKGCMLWLGCRDEKYSSPLHSDTFGFNEDALLTGVEIYEKLIF